jgi:hypothetical protein
LDEGTVDSTVIDLSGNGFDGTPVNSPSPSTDVPANIPFTDSHSLYFQGEQSVTIDDDPAFEMTDATFSVWVKFTDLNAGDMNMIAKRTYWGDEVQWQFGYDGTDSFKFTLAISDAAEGNCCIDFNWKPSSGITTGVWYNIAVVINDTDKTITWYSNGERKHRESIGEAFLGPQISVPLSLGASYEGADEYLRGYLDDVRIYNVALTDEEIAAFSARSRPTSNSQQNASFTFPNCTATAPTGVADLFQIDAKNTQATLFFAPAPGEVSNYFVSYGYSADDERFGVFTNQGSSTGVLSYTINDLPPNMTFYFKVRPFHECSPGNWSNEMKITSPKGNTGVHYYKSFLSQVFRVFN